MKRLQKVIAESGLTSRRKAEELILQKKVKVNGNIVTELGTKVSQNDRIEVNNKILEKENKEYFLLNKPRGVITSTKDDKSRKTVIDLINTTARIYPVGRLDYDTTGLLILTNDGNLANILMHPSNDITKTYIAKLEGILTMEEYFRLKDGIVIDGVKCVPKKVKIRKKTLETNTCMVEISIVEGRNHIIKKLFASVNHSVIKLKRESFAFLSVKNLKSKE